LSDASFEKKIHSMSSGVPSVDALVQGAGDARGEFDVNDVFSLRKPKDFAGGVSSGLQSIGKSVLMGASALVAAPIVGARTEGAAGFAKGLGLGVASAAILPVVGASVGAVQMVRGACATPEAIGNARAGKRWDSRARRWIADDLRVEAEGLGATTDEEILDRARARAEARGARPGVQGLFDEAAGGGAWTRRNGILRRFRVRADRHGGGNSAQVLRLGEKVAPR
jgi:hypothetical protein